MTKYATALSRQVVSIIIIAYAIGFWRSANRLTPGPHVVYPELIIMALVAVIVVDAFMRTLQLLSSREPIPVPLAGDDEYTGPKYWPERPVEALTLAIRSQTRTLVIFAMTVLSVFLIPRLGFFEIVFVFLLVGFWFLGLRRIPTLLAVWASTSFLIWFTFTQLLVVQRIPRGALSTWLF
jgi:hypothetical protein